MLFAIRDNRDALCIALVALCQFRDGGRHSGREHQCAACRWGFAEDKLKVLAEAQIEHLVRLVQHHGADVGEVDVVAFDVVTQTAWSGDNDVRATVERATLGAGVHAANTSGDNCARFAVKPCQLTTYLHGKLACGGDDEGQWRACAAEMCLVAQQCGGDGHAECHGLARAGLGGNQKVRAVEFGRYYGVLNGCHCIIALSGQCVCDRLNQGVFLSG